ncbi:hypothetical protein [Lentzea sp. NPDC059081]|uniref:hypothetical protein n=1 Tax=Lentzea sp. NPDC059081 TaxID=3346719 RepID=UPI00368FA442
MRGLAAVLLCLVLASCGQVPPAEVPASRTQVVSTATPPSSPAPSVPSSVASSPVPTTTLPSRAGEPGTTTVRGTVSGGVESGCLILTTGTESYLLLGADPAIAVAGAVVEVSGRADPGAMTTCQQGTPFHVTRTQRG